MYTATWPKEVCKIAGNLLVDPVQVNNGNTDELAANKSITQVIMMHAPEKSGDTACPSINNYNALSLEVCL
jgi:superfamily II DNA/RNA helicase